jgi:hypothetical protein
VEVVLGADGIDVLDNVGVVELLEEEDLSFDGSQVFGLHVCELQALDGHKVTRVCVFGRGKYG